ncbi:hypothetical protein BRADI_2g11942v3 [Brachypodium distachyon]|uniref:Uncharacterized protein n=1 Tax=Brachypodium distachyon TaxID=15368 RepID=A0A0Q3MI94_BRADI|nr:hypothetical protein BRADI_2g11942v3 [Brachypodium distachyon]
MAKVAPRLLLIWIPDSTSQLARHGFGLALIHYGKKLWVLLNQRQSATTRKLRKEKTDQEAAQFMVCRDSREDPHAEKRSLLPLTSRPRLEGTNAGRESSHQRGLGPGSQLDALSLPFGARMSARPN